LPAVWKLRTNPKVALDNVEVVVDGEEDVVSPIPAIASVVVKGG